NAPKVGPVIRRVKHLAWFKNEHDEAPAAPLADLTPEKLGELADELTRTRDGQFVVGRAVPADEAARWTEAQYRSAALETFRAQARALSPPRQRRPRAGPRRRGIRRRAHRAEGAAGGRHVGLAPRRRGAPDPGRSARSIRGRGRRRGRAPGQARSGSLSDRRPP